jgi:hypothetical protein
MKKLNGSVMFVSSFHGLMALYHSLSGHTIQAVGPHVHDGIMCETLNKSLGARAGGEVLQQRRTVKLSAQGLAAMRSANPGARIPSSSIVHIPVSIGTKSRVVKRCTQDLGSSAAEGCSGVRGPRGADPEPCFQRERLPPGVRQRRLHQAVGSAQAGELQVGRIP